MTNPLILVRSLDTLPTTPRQKRKHEKLKPRRVRRKEERDRDRAAKGNAK